MSQEQLTRQDKLSHELDLVITDPDTSLSSGAEHTLLCVIAALEKRRCAALSATQPAQAAQGEPVTLSDQQDDVSFKHFVVFWEGPPWDAPDDARYECPTESDALRLCRLIKGQRK